MASKNKNNSALLLIFTLIFVFTTIFARTARAGWYLDSEGNLSYEENGSVLGKDDDEDDDDDSDDDENDDEEDDDNDDSNDDDDDDDDDDDKEEYEAEIRQGGRKIKIESRNGKLIIKQEIDDDEDENEIEEDSIFEIDEHKSKARIKIATGSGEFVYITRGNASAKTNFPLAINPETNELLVTTPAGTKVVAILPDEAIANMLRDNIFDEIDEPGDDDLPENEDLAEVEDSVDLVEQEDGELVYEIEGTSDQKVLGLFDIKVKKKAIVSAETGELLELQRTFLQALLDLISF